MNYNDNDIQTLSEKVYLYFSSCTTGHPMIEKFQGQM